MHHFESKTTHACHLIPLTLSPMGYLILWLWEMEMPNLRGLSTKMIMYYMDISIQIILQVKGNNSFFIELHVVYDT